MIDKIRAFCRRKELLHQGDRILLGLSGGADSSCLFLVLLELAMEWELTLVPVHINHNLRGKEAKKDECFCKELCQMHGLELLVVSMEVKELAKVNGWTLEEAGRNARYEAFSKLAKEYHCNKIAVAHHKNDQAETVLFQLFRGSRIKGLSGMSAKNGAIIRPLLCITREEIEQYLYEKNQTYCIDSTNFEEEYTRNVIRGRIIPAVKEIQPKAVEHIVETAEYLQKVELYLEHQTKELYQRAVKEQNGVVLSITELLKADSLLAERVVYQALCQSMGQKKDITAGYVVQCMELMKKQTGKQIHLPQGRIAKRNYEELFIGCKEEESSYYQEITAFPFEAILPKGGQKLSLFLYEVEKKDGNFAEKMDRIPNCTYTKWFDYDKIDKSIALRTPEKEDTIVLYTDGRKKRALDVLSNAKVPKEERMSYWILAEGNRVIWIPGVRNSEAYRVTKETKRILVATIDGGTRHEG